MNIYQTTPFTYLIGWTKLNKWYYGSRTANNCHPTQLWSTYFTSSLTVKDYIKKYGNPDIIKIRRIFKTKKKAIEWEHKVLQKLWKYKEYWLNKRFDTTRFVQTPESIEKNIKSKKSRPKEKQIQVQKNISEGAKLGHKNMSEITKEQRREKLSKIQLSRTVDEKKIISTKLSNAAKESARNRSDEEWDIIKKKKSNTWKLRKINGVKKKITKEKCPECGQMITKSNISRHINSINCRNFADKNDTLLPSSSLSEKAKL